MAVDIINAVQKVRLDMDILLGNLSRADCIEDTILICGRESTTRAKRRKGEDLEVVSGVDQTTMLLLLLLMYRWHVLVMPRDSL